MRPVAPPTKGPSHHSARAGACGTRTFIIPMAAYAKSATPKATDAHPAFEPVIRPAPAHEPIHTPDCISQSRRTSLPRPGPLTICQTFVMNAGTSKRAAAWAGGIARLSRPIPTVGRPRPVTPLTNPASKNAPATTRGWMIGLDMTIQLAPGSNLRNEPFRNPAFACNIGRMVVRRGFVPCISI